MMTGMASELANPSLDPDVGFWVCVVPNTVLECVCDTIPNASMGSLLTSDQFVDPGTYRMLFALVRCIRPTSPGTADVRGIFRSQEVGSDRTEEILSFSIFV
jgi:hypothetical protein